MTSEFGFIENLRRRLPMPSTPGETWIGDDAAALLPAEGWQLLACDLAVAGVHADLGLVGIDDFGWKALAACMSDIAAMGGEPRHALIGVAAPTGTDLELLYEGIEAAAREFECRIVGGDLVGSPSLTVAATVSGSCRGRPVLRSGGRPGHLLWVTGPLGAAAAGLRLLRSLSERGDCTSTPKDQGGTCNAGERDDLTKALVRAHARPIPLIEAGRRARMAGASAMIDVSDGFSADLTHLAQASEVGFRLHRVPVAPGATLEEALSGGEDYQLIVSAPPEVDLTEAFEGLDRPLVVGELTDDPRHRTLNGVELEGRGWQHLF